MTEAQRLESARRALKLSQRHLLDLWERYDELDRAYIRMREYAISLEHALAGQTTETERAA